MNLRFKMIFTDTCFSKENKNYGGFAFDNFEIRSKGAFKQTQQT